jgi:hypothetical protein
MVLQDQIRSTTSGIEYIDTLDLSQAEVIVDESPTGDPVTSGTLISDMNFLRTAVRDIKGSAVEVDWFGQVVDNPAFTTLSGARGSLNNIHTYIGSTDDFDTTPDYDTLGGPAPVFVNQGDPVNVAIEKLDEALATVSGSAAGEIQKQRHIRDGGNVAKNTTLDLSDLIAGQAGWTSEGDTIIWSDATDFVENVSVFHNGVLMLPGVDANADRDVYHVATPDQLAFEFRIKKNDIIQIWKFPPA